MARALSERNRSSDLARAFAASTSRERGGALVTSEASSCRAASATSSTARSKAAWFALEGRVKPLNLRTNCREDARISSSVAGGLKLWSVLMLRHMTSLANFAHECLLYPDRAAQTEKARTAPDLCRGRPMRSVADIERLP